MNSKYDNKYLKLGITITLSVFICIVFYMIAQEWRGIIDVISMFISAIFPIFIGIVIAFLLSPIMCFFEKKTGIVLFKLFPKAKKKNLKKTEKTISIILTMSVFFFIIIGFLWVVLPSVSKSLQQLINGMPAYVEKVQEWIQKTLSENLELKGQFAEGVEYVQLQLTDVIEKKILPNLDTIFMQVSSGIIDGVKILFNFIIGIIIAVYLLASKEKLIGQVKKIVYCVFNKNAANNIIHGGAYANSVFSGFINGKILDSFIIGIICFVFTQSMGMTYAVLISVIIGVTNIIPFFGPFIGAVPAGLLALMDDPLTFLVFMIFVFILQQIDGNIIGPLILGDSTGISGVWVLFAILVGGDLFGIPGMILGVPVFACIYALISVIIRDRLRKKNLSTTTEDYILLDEIDSETGEMIYHNNSKRRKFRVREKKKNFCSNKKGNC